MDTALPTRRPRMVGPRVLGVIAGAALALAALVVFAGPGGASREKLKALPPVVTADGLLQTVGVRVTRVALSGDGGLLDMRFQVVDPDKAADLHDTSTPPALVDENSGQVIGRLLMGHAHSGTFKAGVTYYYVFEDPGGLVKRGHEVSVVLGPARVEHIRVQ